MAVGQNKRRIERLERRIVILEDELGLDHSDVLEAEDDAEIVTDGGQDTVSQFDTVVFQGGFSRVQGVGSVVITGGLDGGDVLCFRGDPFAPVQQALRGLDTGFGDIGGHG